MPRKEPDYVNYRPLYQPAQHRSAHHCPSCQGVVVPFPGQLCEFCAEQEYDLRSGPSGAEDFYYSLDGDDESGE